MSEMVVVWRGCVEQWECDFMGHLNVRHYMQRSLDGVAGLALALGFGPRRLDAMQQAFVVREHHVRFHAELLAGVPCVMRSGVLDASEERLRVYQELRRVPDDALSATFVLEVEVSRETGFRPEPLSGELRARAHNQRTDLPAHAAPKGLVLDPPRPSPTVTEADDLDLEETYRGAVPRQETDLLCRMQTAAYMGVLSSAAPQFFHGLGDLELGDGVRAGPALLEARLVYRLPPILGDVLAVRSGLKLARSKTLHFCHWMFHEETGECVCSAELVAAMLDLGTRRVVAPSRAAQLRLKTRALASLTP